MNIKFYFRLCFKIKIKEKKKEKYKDKLYLINGIQKYFIHLVQLNLKLKEKILKKKEKCKKKLVDIRKKSFIKELKNVIIKKKYEKMIYINHDKIFSYAIGIINLKNKCIGGIKSKSNKFRLKKTKEFFNIFKQRAISNNKIRRGKLILKKYIIQSNFNKIKGKSRINISMKKKEKEFSLIYKKFYLKKYLEGLNASYKMKLIDNKVDDYYKTKRKKNFLNMLKKEYQNSIKYSMLSLRFNEYLIISTFNNFFKAINKNKNEKIQFGFNNNDN